MKKLSETILADTTFAPKAASFDLTIAPDMAELIEELKIDLGIESSGKILGLGLNVLSVIAAADNREFQFYRSGRLLQCSLKHVAVRKSLASGCRVEKHRDDAPCRAETKRHWRARIADVYHGFLLGLASPLLWLARKL